MGLKSTKSSTFARACARVCQFVYVCVCACMRVWPMCACAFVGVRLCVCARARVCACARACVGERCVSVCVCEHVHEAPRASAHAHVRAWMCTLYVCARVCVFKGA